MCCYIVPSRVGGRGAGVVAAAELDSYPTCTAQGEGGGDT